MPVNWIEGRNPYKLTEPSPWWLKLLGDYDAQLVVMPSVKDCAYRLCRRVRREQRLGLAPLITHQHPDTVQMIQYGLVPVATLTTWAIRSDKTIRDLMRRDTWNLPKGKTAADVAEDRDQRRAQRLQTDTVSTLDAVSGDAFRSLQFRNGSAVALSGPRHRAHNSVISPRPTAPPPSASPRIVLTDAP